MREEMRKGAHGCDGTGRATKQYQATGTHPLEARKGGRTMVMVQAETVRQHQATGTGAPPLSATCSPAPPGSVTRRGVLRSVRCVGVGALTGMALLAACGGERLAVAPSTSKLQGKLTIWGAPGDGANWDNDFGHQMVSEFQSTYPGVTIETASTGPQGGNPADEKFLVAAKRIVLPTSRIILHARCSSKSRRIASDSRQSHQAWPRSRTWCSRSQ